MDARGSLPCGPPPDEAGHECLHSWKEIAAYLGCSERTVRRWEQAEGLPVYRHPHKKKAAIYAYRAELDTWWNNGHGRLEQRERERVPIRWRPLMWLGLAVLAAVAGTATWRVLSRAAPQVAPPPSTVVPLTSLGGMEFGPALSPDGTQVAFLWDGETGSFFPDLYVKTIDAVRPLRLTNTPDGYESHPAWSPDGRVIAFTRTDKSGAGIFTVEALGGMERKVADLVNQLGTGLDWSPDGKYLAFSDRESAHTPTSIYLLLLATRERRRLTLPPAELLGDTRPAFSPDSSALAFVRTGSNLSWIAVTPVTGGEPKRLMAPSHRPILGIAWTADSRDLVYSAPVPRGATNYGLWRIPAGGGTPKRVTNDLEDAYAPTVARRGNRLAYARASADVNIWRLEVPRAGRRASPTTLLIGSTRQDGAPAYSPDGRKIAFQSDRLGSREIWSCDADGSNPVQLTFFDDALPGPPRWSPDGRQIVFRLIATGSVRRPGVYVVASGGGVPREVISGDREAEGAPSWSRDGKWIYFGSARAGRTEVWRVPSEGGQPLKVTRNGGTVAFESPDARHLYYVKPDSAGLWRMPVEGGVERRVLEFPEPANWGSWAIVNEGIYFLNGSAPPHGALEFYRFATGQVTRVMLFEKAPDTWDGALAVSPDGHWILFSQVDSENSDLVLIQNFR